MLTSRVKFSAFNFNKKSTKLNRVRSRISQSMDKAGTRRDEIESLLCHFLHSVQSAAGLEPGDLQVVEAVVQLNLFRLSVGVFDFSGQLFAWREALEAKD